MLFDLSDQKSLKPIDERQQTNLKKFLALLGKWNKTRNLVSRKTSIRDLNHHVIDCLALNKELNCKKLLDVGSGAGFPGVVTAISNPQMEITLLDSNLKKVSFLNHVKAELQLKNIKVVHKRIEDFDLSKEDWLVSRAFSSPEELINKIKEKAPRDLVFLMMVSKNIKPSILGYDVDYIESPAANILKKNRGFLKISLSKN